MTTRAKWRAVTPLRLLVALAVTLAPLVLFAAPASAGVALSVSPNLGPGTVTVGQTGVAGNLTIRNNSDGAQTTGTVTLGAITLIPSCGGTNVGHGDCSAPDPGVFVIHSPAIGLGGTACAGVVFTVTMPDPVQGKYLFTPASPIVLQQRGATDDACTIDFTFDTIKAPAIDADTGTLGLQTNQIADAEGLHSPTAVGGQPLPGSGQGTNVTTVLQAASSITTTASGPVAGGFINDTATLVTTAPPPTAGGTITFGVFGPYPIGTTPTCAGLPPAVVTVPVSGAGAYVSGPVATTGPGVYQFVATYSGDLNYVGSATPCTDTAERVTVLQPVISVTKVASPLSRPEPGGTFTFTVQVHNPSPNDPITITSLIDNIYGNLATRAGSTCGTLIGTTLAPGATSAPCTFTGPFNGVAGATQTDTVTVNGMDANGNTATATAQATVAIVPAPVISVTKVASPLSRPEPGGTFTFTVQVHNPSTNDPIKITSLVDNIYGDLATRAGSTCGTLIGTTLAPGATSAPCTFTGPFNGVAGASQTDTVTVNGVDANGNTATATAQATVTIVPAPVISVTKVASPLSRVEPGGTFTFTVQVHNPSTVDAITITTLTDNIYGDLATRAGSTCGALIGSTLAPGATSAPCTFTGTFTGVAGATQTDTVTVTGIDSNGNTATATATATVTIVPLPVIAVLKVASPLSRPEPGGTFTFTVTVHNPSTNDPIKITSLVDNIYGNLATRAGSTCGTLIGTTLAPGATSAPCSFTGPFTGVAGASQTDTVTVNGVDANGNTATATAQATVTIVPLPVISVTKVASPLSRPAPGGTFTFTVTVHNPSTNDPIKITSLTDNIYGDLATRPGSTCGTLIGTTLAPGATSAPCSFSGPFTGLGGDTQTDTVTVNGVDANGNTATASALATVTLTTSMPSISVTKTPSPLTLPEPGGTFTFTVTVHNPNALEDVKITTLTDNIYGDLATRAGSTCGTLIGTTLAPGATSAPCSFTGPFTGHGGDTQTDIVTVTGVSPAGVTVTATATATVGLTVVLPQINLTKVASPTSRLEPGGDFTFTVTVSNPSAVDPVKITSLVDNIYGDLATRAGSTCGTLIGVTLAPGATSAPCTFTGPFTGVAGASQTDIVTVTGVDTQGHTVTKTATATVTITAGTGAIAVTKSANPSTLPAPGGTFTYTVTVKNPGTAPLKITSLVDNIYGDLATRAGSTCGSLIGTTLAPGATSAPCTFTGPYTTTTGGSQTDTVTATGVTPNGTKYTATASATVTVTPPPVATASSAQLALTGDTSGGRTLLAAGLIVVALLLLLLLAGRRRSTT